MKCNMCKSQNVNEIYNGVVDLFMDDANNESNKIKESFEFKGYCKKCLSKAYLNLSMVNDTINEIRIYDTNNNIVFFNSTDPFKPNVIIDIIDFHDELHHEIDRRLKTI